MKITKKYLIAHSACKENVKFFARNNLEGLDLANAKGDFNGYIRWLKNLPKLAYDEKGNLVKKILPDGSVQRYEYDENGNRIKEIFPNGSVYEYEYDENGNLVKKILPDGSVQRYEYDLSNGIKITQNGEVILDWKRTV